MKKVCVIIPNWNGKHFLKKCLDSLYANSFKDFDVLLVDNGSTDDSVRYVKENYPDVLLIENTENKGFAYAVNQALTESMNSHDTIYSVLLNNDTETDKDFLLELVKAMDSSPELFSASAKMLMYDNPKRIDDAGDLYTIFGMAFQRGHGKESRLFDNACSITASCGGACILRNSFLNYTALFPDYYFAYREDLDLGIRAKLLGYKNLYVPSAKVIHYGSGTANNTGKAYNAFKVRLGARNLVYLNTRLMPFPMLLINFPFLLLGIIIKFVFFLPKKLGITYIKAVFEGLSDVFSGKNKRFRAGFRHFPCYLKFELELIANCFRII